MSLSLTPAPRLYCTACRKTSELAQPFECGTIATVSCPACSVACTVRSPRPVREEDMLAELGGDASLVAIETSPEADDISAETRALPCLQMAEFYVTDATGKSVDELHAFGADTNTRRILGSTDILRLKRAFCFTVPGLQTAEPCVVVGHSTEKVEWDGRGVVDTCRDVRMCD